MEQLTTFANVPSDILTDPRLSLQAKGLYSVICTFGVEKPVSFDQILAMLKISEQTLDPIWDEMMSFMQLREKEEELQKAIKSVLEDVSKEQMDEK